MEINYLGAPEGLFMTRIDDILNKIASTSSKTIKDQADRSLEGEVLEEVSGHAMGHRTRSMMKRNRLYRRLIGDLDPP